MLADQAPEAGQVADLVDRLAKGREVRHNLGEIAAGARPPAAGPLRSVHAQRALDHLQQRSAPFRPRWGTFRTVALAQSTGLPKDPGITETTSAEGGRR